MSLIIDEAQLLDLRSGRTVWELDEIAPTQPNAPPVENIHSDVVIVGAGITGAFLADRFARQGREVIVIDRHAPQKASTSASTALLQWEIDAPMLELEQLYGYETAAGVYRRSVLAVREIAATVESLPDDCGFALRDTVFLSGDSLDAADLREEQRIRDKAGIHGACLDQGELAARFGFIRDAALLYGGSAQANPVRLARALMDRAVAHGARIISPALATNYNCGVDGVAVALETGAQITGNILLLANGYEMPPFVPGARHTIASTWAVATRPQLDPSVFWENRALVWEASDSYAYMRFSGDNRIIIGGGDEELTDAAKRDALTPAKIAMLQESLRGFVPHADTTLDAAWTGFFGETDDGLPMIGPVPGHPRCYAAFGYGGNGITFSAMAADILATLVAGGADPAADWFAVDR